MIQVWHGLQLSDPDSIEYLWDQAGRAQKATKWGNRALEEGGQSRKRLMQWYVRI